MTDLTKHDLHKHAIGTAFWTKGGLLRVRLERFVDGTDLCHCSLFNLDGGFVRSQTYFNNGVPTEGDIYAIGINWDACNIGLKATHIIFDGDEPAPEDVPTFEHTIPDTHGVAATSGHCASNGGLRGHSVGDVFPYIPFFKGTETQAIEQWVRTPSGDELGPFANLLGMKAAIEFDQLIKKVTFADYNHIAIFSYDNYDDYEEALHYDGVYQSHETIDHLGTTNGVYETIDAVTTVCRCLGNKDIALGIVSNEGVFVTLEDYVAILERNK